MNASINNAELSTFNYVDVLVERYNRDLERALADYAHIRDMPNKDLMATVGLKFDYGFKRLSLEEGSKIIEANLRADSWNQVYVRSNVEHYLSSDTKRQLKEANERSKKQPINEEYALPEFTVENVKATILEWSKSRSVYFNQRVDSVFSKLSDGHLTNHPSGFNRKIILSYGCEKNFFREDIGRITERYRETLHDLRSSIMVVNGLPIPEYSEIHALTSDLSFGHFIDMDDGLWSMRLFKNGNLHILINEQTAAELNWHLAQLYPNCLADYQDKEAIRKKKGKVAKTFVYRSESASRELRNSLNAITEGSYFSTYSHSCADFIKYTGFGLDEIEFVRSKKDEFQSVAEAFNKFGVPNIKDYQFFATPKVIADYLKNACVVDDGDLILDPSAGCGSLSMLYPENTECYELFTPFVEILKFKGLKATQADFLTVTPVKRYNKVFMNPPYANKRLESHFEHALKFLVDGGEIYIIAPTGKERDLMKIAQNNGKSLRVLQEFDSVFEDTKILTSLFLIK